MCRRTASGVSLTEAASRVDAGPGPWSSAAAGSPVLPRDVRRTSRRNAPATRNSAACRMSDRWCTRRANCSGAELLGVRWRTSAEDSPQRQVRKEKGLLRWGLKKGVGHPAAIAAAGRPGCSAPATLAPAAGRFPRTIPRKLAGKCLSVDAQKLRRTPLVPADNLEGLEGVAPIEPLADAEVPRVVDRRLRAQRAALLVVLLDARAFVVDVQRGGDALGEHPGAEAARRATGDAAAEDELDLVGAADVEILADDLLEEDAAGHRTVEDLREGEFGLQDGDVVAVAGTAIGGGEGMGEAAEPLAHEGVDLGGREPIRDRLRPARVGAGEEAVVERLEGDAGAGELAFQVLVSVEAERGRVGEVRGELEEARAEVAVDAVEVVVVHHGCAAHEPGVALAGAGIAPLLGAEHRRLFLGAADEDHAFLPREVGPVGRLDVFLAADAPQGAD